MKIAQVCPYNIYRGGGVQSHILFLADELRKLGHEVKIIASDVDTEGEDPLDNLITLGRGKLLPFQDTQMEITIEPNRNKIRKILEEEKFDILHYHTPECPFLSLQILSESRGVNISTHHSTYPDTFSAKSLEKIWGPLLGQIVGSFDTVIAVSEVPARPLYRYGPDDLEVKIVPNGIDVNVFNPDNKPLKDIRKDPDEKIILFLGRLDKRKGVIYLLKAFEKIQTKMDKVRLVIAGKGDEFENLQEYATQNNIKNVDFLGFVPEEDKPALYASCDVYCSPAIYGESFGIVLLEAMATRKAVVSTAIDGHKSVIKDTGRLLLAQPKNADDLADKLLTACIDDKLRDHFADWGVKEAQKYAWPNVARQLEKIYKGALQKRAEKTASQPEFDWSIDNIISKFTDKLKQNIPDFVSMLNGFGNGYFKRENGEETEQN